MLRNHHAASRPCTASSATETPTPQRKRRRQEDPDVVIISERCVETVPCEICGENVAFEAFLQHMSIHEQAQPQPSSRPDVKEDLEDIACEICGRFVAFDDFAEHMKGHGETASSSSRPKGDMKACEVCGTMIESEDLEDHLAAHRVHQELLDSELQNSTSAVDIAAQIVEMARSRGSGLPGNRSLAGAGDAVLVRWSDGHWYAARILQTYEDGRHQVGWDPPYSSWKNETALADCIIPRMNQPREICNFDVAVAFINRLCALQKQTEAESCLEVVYHWTREENVQKIVENNLRPPGSTNTDGTTVRVLNGEVLGRGIYASTNVEFGRSFGCGLSCAFLCLAVPGLVARAVHSGAQHGLSIGNSDCFKNGEVRVYRTSEQVLPLFFTDAAQAPRLKACAQEIADFLISKGLGTPPPVHAWKVGQSVEVLWHGSYWKAQIAKVHSEGCDIKWLPPFHRWPHFRASANDLRSVA